MQKRTDLALECYEEQSATEIDGVEVKENEKFSVVKILNENGSKILEKPVGTYITYKVPSFVTDTDIFDGRLDALADFIKNLLPADFSGTVLIVGLGNSNITADALGPMVNNFVLATRHLNSELKNQIGLNATSNVATITTGVLGQTGIETAEIIKGVSAQVNPACIIVVDALASSSVDRLGNTVQISDAGIFPGSGVGNHRFEISRSTMGVPVISIGIPTVVASSVIIKDSNETKSEEDKEKLFVTPREIDQVIEHGAKLIGMSINVALQSNMSPKDLFALVG